MKKFAKVGICTAVFALATTAMTATKAVGQVCGDTIAAGTTVILAADVDCTANLADPDRSGTSWPR